MEALVASRCLETLAGLGISPGRIGRDASELARTARVSDDRRGTFSWILRKLSVSGLLEGDPPGRIDALRESPWSRDALASAIESEPRLRSTLEFVDLVTRQYPAFLRGEVEGSRVLFSPESMALWPRYFSNENLSYAAINALGAAAVASATSKRLRVLEVGAGCGSGTLALLEAIAPWVESYVMTEVSPRFLKLGSDAVRERFPEVPLSVKRVDVNRPLPEQGVERGFDLVYAVNTLHCARDLLASLRELRLALGPGGLLVLAEAIRPTPGFPVPIEYVFQLTNEFQTFVREPGIRESGGFLYWEDWRRALERSGFERVRFVPELERAIRAYPSYSMAAALGEVP